MKHLVLLSLSLIGSACEQYVPVMDVLPSGYFMINSSDESFEYFGQVNATIGYGSPWSENVWKDSLRLDVNNDAIDDLQFSLDYSTEPLANPQIFRKNATITCLHDSITIYVKPVKVIDALRILPDTVLTAPQRFDEGDTINKAGETHNGPVFLYYANQQLFKGMLQNTIIYSRSYDPWSGEGIHSICFRMRLAGHPCYGFVKLSIFNQKMNIYFFAMKMYL